MRPRVGETVAQRRDRCWRTCYHCGREDPTVKESLTHEVRHDRTPDEATARRALEIARERTRQTDADDAGWNN